MAIDRDDEYLLRALNESMERVEALELMEVTGEWRQTAIALLSSATQEFEELVHREDLEELEAQEALALLRDTRQGLDRAFQDALSHLDIYLGEQRLKHDPSHQEALNTLAHFLNRFHGGEFESLRTRQAISVAQEASDLLHRLGLGEGATQPLEERLNAITHARASAGDEGAEAIQAYAELVEGRSVARVCYLTARDLLSAALRFEGRHEELNALIPPIHDILKVGFV